MPPEASRPGRHPNPPTDLADRSLRRLAVEPGQQWMRAHRFEHDPLSFSRSGTGRFDAPNGEYGVLYAGGDVHCAFIETFGRALGLRVVSEGELRTRCFSRIAARRSLWLVDLTGPGLAAIGADARLCTGDYAVAQRWALALWDLRSRPDGLCWRSRFDPQRLCVALYDRAADALTAERLGHLLETGHRPLLADVLDTYSFGLI